MQFNVLVKWSFDFYFFHHATKLLGQLLRQGLILYEDKEQPLAKGNIYILSPERITYSNIIPSGLGLDFTK